MVMTPRLLLASAALLFSAGLTTQACSAAPPPAESAADAAPTFNTDYSIREVMTNIIDPVADHVWDATGVDITKEGTVERTPTTDEDWALVMRGAVSIVEGANLLKMKRRVAPAHDNEAKNPGELHPDEVQALIDKAPGVWNAYVSGLQAEGLKIAQIAKERNLEKLTQAGTELDKVCESCHLQFWYPGDREAVERDRNSKVTQVPGAK